MEDQSPSNENIPSGCVLANENIPSGCVLSNLDILREKEKGDVVIEPFNEANLSNWLYDVTLGEHYYKPNSTSVINPFSKKPVKEASQRNQSKKPVKETSQRNQSKKLVKEASQRS